jgi:pre-mRNA-splicing factor SYF1
MYLSKFVERYGGSKLERARDMFEQVLSKVGAEQARVFYLLFARLEEDYGLARHAMHIYDRACKALPMEERFEVYMIYISRAQDFFGVMNTREIYAQAVEVLPDAQAAVMCLKFNKVELMLGEVDRAREVLMHGAQFCDPRAQQGAADYWQKWHEFEVSHGNEDTFREMLRVKRSVQLQFTEISFHASDVANAAAAADEAANNMEKLEQDAPEPEEPVKEEPEVLQNPEEIDIDMDDDGEEEDEIEHKEIPAAVFGDATALAENNQAMGALERLKAKK